MRFGLDRRGMDWIRVLECGGAVSRLNCPLNPHLQISELRV